MTCVARKKTAVCLALLVLVFGSCRQDGDRAAGEGNVGRASGPDSVDAAASVDPLELWQRVRAAYAQAAHYHDDGKLILRYRLNDRPMEEHQLWAIDFDRTGRLAARVFNARLQSDAARTTLRVFDWNSENMDNQVVVHPGFDSELWSRLHQDPVSRHFLMGVGEMPFSPDLDPRQLIPLVARLLQGPAADDWLAESASPQHVGREPLDGHDLEILTVGWDTERVRLWIDPTAYRIVQVELPLSMLEPRLLQSPEISGLRLLARLDNASFEPAAVSEVFSTALPDDCHPVRAFVPLPDRFPSEAIGKPFPPVKFTDRQGASLELDSNGAAGKLFVWIDGTQSSREVAEQFASLEGPPVQAIFLDYQPERAGAAEPSVRVRALAALHPDLIQDSTWLDLDNAAGRQLHVPFAPTAVLVDAQGVVQYFQTLLDPEWQKTLQTAIRRVADGEDLAGEMRSEYQAFLDKYRERLAAANPLATEPLAPTQPVAALTAVPRLEPIWEFTDVKQPGNLLWSESGDTLFALDG